MYQAILFLLLKKMKINILFNLKCSFLFREMLRIFTLGGIRCTITKHTNYLLLTNVSLGPRKKSFAFGVFVSQSLEEKNNEAIIIFMLTPL